MRPHSHRRRGSGCHRPAVPRPTRHLATVEECKSVIQLGKSYPTVRWDGVGTSVDHPRPIGPRHGSVSGTRWTQARLLNHRLRGVKVSRGTSLHKLRCSRPLEPGTAPVAVKRMSSSLRRQGWCDTFSSRRKRDRRYAGPMSKEEAY